MSTQLPPINVFDYSTIQVWIIAGIKANLESMNAGTLSSWKGTVNDYLTNATHVMELNVGRAVPLPAPTKPAPPLVATLVDAPASDKNHLPVAVQYVQLPPCPDPPPLPIAPPAGNVQVGVYDFGTHGVGGYWSSGLQDTYKGTDPVMATSADGVSGTWDKVAFFMGNGWYIRRS